jgi:hypothetical protein
LSTDLQSVGWIDDLGCMFCGMNRRLTVLTRQRGGWFTRADALHAGYSDSEIRLRLRVGQWLRLCRDTYVEPAGWPDDEPSWDRTRRLHTLMARAVSLRMGNGVAISHQSATLLHGLPGWGLNFDQVQVTRTAGRVRSDRSMKTHRSPLAADDTTLVEGLCATTPARAIVEATCTSSYEIGVALCDAALQQGLVKPDQLAATADRLSHWRGSPAARAAARFADGLSESVGESRLRVLMANEGIPAPELQVEIRDSRGRLLGRVDFLVLRRLIVEFDGAQKYDSGGTDVVLAEKWREDRLRELGYAFVRVGWADLDHPRDVGDRLRKALVHARVA